MLRTRTAAAHEAAEVAFDLPARLASQAGYGELLVLLRVFYGPLEAALAALTGWDRLTPPVDLVARRRAALIDADLAALGIAVPAPDRTQPTTTQPALPVLRSLAQGLGCLYVLEGSALGGQIVARQARATLGQDLPVGFFANPAGPHLGAGWKALRAALVGYGLAAGQQACEAAVLAARQVFAALGDHLARIPRDSEPLDRKTP